MRIYVFTEHYPSTYKPYFDTQFAQLLEDGHDVQVFAFGRFEAAANAKTLSHGLHARTRYVPLTLRTLPAFLAAAAVRGWASPARTATLARAQRGPARAALVGLARALLLPKAPPDLCLIHNLVTAQAYPFLGALYPGVPVALYFHGGEIPRGGTISDAEGRAAFARVDAVFTNTAFSRAQAVTRGCPEQKVHVCPVGFSLADYPAPARKAYRPQGALRLLSVGRVSEEKGLSYAVDAVAALAREGRPVRYRVVGEGPARAQLLARVEREGLGGVVELVGERPAHALVAEYAAADALLLPSVATGRWAETQACVVQEAMLMKLPVVASRTGGVPESLAPELQDWLVPEGDAAALADRLRALEALPHEALAGLGEAGRAFAERRYDIRRLNAELLGRALAARAQATASEPGPDGAPFAAGAQLA